MTRPHARLGRFIRLLFWWARACAAGAPPVNAHGVPDVQVIRQALLQPMTHGAEPVPPVSVALPHRWDDDGRSGRVRYQMVFVGPKHAPAPWSLYIPRVGNRFEVQLNGAVLASHGMMGRTEADYAQHPHLISLPTPPLRPGANTLNIVVDGDAGRYAGLSSIQIGPRDTLASTFALREMAQKWASFTIIIIAIIFAAISAVFSVRTKDRRLMWFAVACCFCAIRTSWAIVVHPPLPLPWWSFVVDACYAGYVLFMGFFCMDLLSLPRKAVLGLSGVLVLATVVILPIHSFGRETWARQWWLLLLILYAVAMFGLLLASWYKNRSRAHAIIAGVAVGAIGMGIYDHLLVFYLPSGFTAFTLSRYSLILFLAAVGWVLSERVLELARARDQAEDSSRAKSRFLAVASHDLRQPLHTLSLLNGLLARPHSQERAREITQQMGRSISNLELLFSSVLDFSKLEAAAVTPNLSWTPLQPLLARVVNDFEAAASDKNLSLTAHGPPLELYTDPALLERVLRNLTENAIKFTDSGAVTISAKQASPQQDCTIRVSDTGIGIAAGEHSEIFAEYYRSNANHTRRDGLGLGLAIVHRLTTLLGLHIGVGDNTPRGTWFELAVPRASVRALSVQDAVPEHADEVDLSDLLVLCVDDDAASLEALAAVLAEWGCRVLTAATVEQALIAARLHPEINVALCDYALGAGMNGEALIQALRVVLGEISGALLTGDLHAVQEHEAGRIEFPVLRKPVSNVALRQLLEVFREMA